MFEINLPCCAWAGTPVGDSYSVSVSGLFHRSRKRVRALTWSVCTLAPARFGILSRDCEGRLLPIVADSSFVVLRLAQGR